MQDIKLKQIKLIKEGLGGALIFYYERNNISSIVKRTVKDPVHEDLAKAVKTLAVHLALMTEFIKPSQTTDTKLLERFTATGFAIGGKDGQEGTVITGFGKTSEGKAFSLNTPFERFPNEEAPTLGFGGYSLMNELMNSITNIEHEVMEYLLHGKKATVNEAQESEDGPVTKMQILPEMTEEEKAKASFDKAFNGPVHESELNGNGHAVNEAGALVEAPVETGKGKRGRKKKDQQ